jgi:hypothetical protein
MGTLNMQRLQFGFVAFLGVWACVAGVTQGVLAQAQEARPTVRAVSLSAALTDPESEYGGSFVLGRQPGIEVVIMANDPKSFFVAVVDQGREKTELRLMVDGKPLKDERGFSNIGFMSNISENGQRVTVPITATELPPKGTRLLKVAGTLILRAGGDEKTDKVRFQVVEGENVRLGPVSAKISDLSEFDFDGPTTNINFETNQSLEAISAIKFFGEDGQALEASSGGSSSFGFGNQMTYTRGFQIKGKPTTLTAEVTYFGSTRTITVPVDLELDLSLGGK